MFSLAIQSGVNCVFPGSSFRCQAAQASICNRLRAACFANPKTNLIQKTRPILRTRRLFTAFAAPEAVAEEAPANTPSSMQAEEEEPVTAQEIQTAGVVGKKVEKPRLVLKFVWMEKNIGLALDQLLPGHGTVPLSPYYFWPRKDAWEELKATLETKPWISQKKMIILLNQATDIINLWQQSGGNLTA